MTTKTITMKATYVVKPVLFVSLLWISVILVGAWSPNYARRLTPLVHTDRSTTNGRNDKMVKAAITAIHLSNTPLGGGDVEDDWRDFRAQLVRSEKADANTKQKEKQKQKDDDDVHWAYDSGDFVERGSVVLSVPSSNPFLDDVDSLNSICYRKSIVLVLDVNSKFIQGIVLNRPTAIGVKEGVDGMQFVQPGHGEVFENEIGLGDGSMSVPHRWKIWFGGEVGGPYSDYPQVMCLHSFRQT